MEGRTTISLYTSSTAEGIKINDRTGGLYSVMKIKHTQHNPINKSFLCGYLKSIGSRKLLNLPTKLNSPLP